MCPAAITCPGKIPTGKSVHRSPGFLQGTKEPRTYAAHIKQCAAWTRDGAEVIFRALRYLPDWPASKPEEKGIDVALAIDFVALAVDGQYDIGVIASTDSDLRPALEFVSRRCGERCRVQVAA